MEFIYDLYSDVVGSSSFTVMDTDYENHAMVCTCQVNKSKTMRVTNLNISLGR